MPPWDHKIHLAKPMGVGIGIQITAQKTQWKISVPLSESIIFAKNPQRIGRNNIKNYRILPESKILPHVFSSTGSIEGKIIT